MVQDPTKTYVNNPQIKIVIYDLIAAFNIEIEKQDIYFEITKDKEEAPNEAEIVIYNLSDSTVSKITELSTLIAPVEIYLTPAGDILDLTGQPNYVLAFSGEVNSVESRQLRPGRETRLVCTGGAVKTETVFVDQKTYPIGTPKALVITDLVSLLNMPLKLGSLPTDTILISQSFSGKAFNILRAFCADHGFNCWVSDGILNISSLYAPTVPAPKTILSSLLLSAPEQTDREDAEEIKKAKVVEELTTRQVALRKGKIRRGQAVGPTVYMQYESVDTSIPGMMLELLCQPDFQPDDVVTIVGNTDPTLIGRLFRVNEVMHYGDNFGGDWTTELQTDNYEAV